jgi:hypothetical protein
MQVIEESVLIEMWNQDLINLYKSKYNNFLIVDGYMNDLKKQHPFEKWKIEFYKINIS